MCLSVWKGGASKVGWIRGTEQVESSVPLGLDRRGPRDAASGVWSQISGNASSVPTSSGGGISCPGSGGTSPDTSMLPNLEPTRP